MAERTRWTRPADLRAQVQRRWSRGELLAARVTGARLFPMTLRLKNPTGGEIAADFEAVRAWIAELRAASAEQRGHGYTLTWQSVRNRVHGSNDLPTGAVAPTAEDALALIGRRSEARRFDALVAATRKRLPALVDWLARRPLKALEYADDWPRLLTLVEWFVAHPRPGCYRRQLDIPGVDTKFIQTRRQLIAELLDLAVPPEAVDADHTGAAGFDARYGLRDKPARLRFRLLDERLAIAGLTDLAVRADEFAAMELDRADPPVTRVFITENEINATRQTYTPAATRGSILYFTVADLGNINEMYQFSLAYFNALFLTCIQQSERAADLSARLKNVMAYASYNIYSNVSRGLFGEHKITFSFMLCTSIMRNAGDVSDVEWQLLLVGAGIVDESTLPPCPDGIEKAQWTLVCTLDSKVQALRGVKEMVAKDVNAWQPLLDAEHPWDAPIPGFAAVPSFSRLLVIKAFRPEKLIECIGSFIAEHMGKMYIEQPPLDLGSAFKDSKCSTPLIFVLSTGADPMSSLIRYATDQNYLERMRAISLGQGQGPIALQLITEGGKSGEWVVLQNCHLARSWMPKLEKVVEGFQASNDIHRDFRLWLTSMPAPYFPVTVLQSAVKMTFEPPKGIRANLQGTWAAITEEQFDRCTKPREWKKLLFGLTFFHAVVQERRKFGPLGWNIRYDFGSTDFEVAMETLRMFLDEQPEIPWEALLYVTGHINYGGRVTDDWDRRNLMCMLRRYYCNDVLADAYRFALDSDAYFAPKDAEYAVRLLSPFLPQPSPPLPAPAAHRRRARPRRGARARRP